MSRSEKNPKDSSNSYPLLPLRDVVVYPQIVQPLFVGRPKSIKALENAMAADKQILLVAQKNGSEDEPSIDNLFGTGTIASILQLIRLPDGTVKVLVEGLTRAKLGKVLVDSDCFIADITELHPDELEDKDSD